MILSRLAELKSVTIAVPVILLAMTGFLFSPRVPAGEEAANCVSVIDIGPAHLHLNCDSGEFERVAANPSLMLSSNRTRQNRPLSVMLGWTLAKPFHMMGVATGSAEYAGFITLNFLLLLCACLLFTRISGARWLLDPLTLFPLSVIVVNQVTKAFFWTPHLQIFNILIPIASLALFRWIFEEAHPLGWWRAFLLGVALGIGALAYGGFAITAAGAAICIMAGRLVRVLRVFFGAAARAGLLLLAFLAPTAAWTTFVTYRTGSFYSREIDHYRQFVWMTDSLQTGGFSALLKDFAMMSGEFGDTLRVVMPFSLLTVGALATLLYARGGLREIVRGNEMLLRSIVVYVTVDLLFFWLMGFYASRLTWTIVPAVALLIAVEMQALDRVASDGGRRALRGASAVATVLYMAYWYVRPGPWS